VVYADNSADLPAGTPYVAVRGDITHPTTGVVYNAEHKIPVTPDTGRGFYAFSVDGGSWHSKDGIAFAACVKWTSAASGVVNQIIAAGCNSGAVVVGSNSTTYASAGVAKGTDTKREGVFKNFYTNVAPRHVAICRAPDYTGEAVYDLTGFGVAAMVPNGTFLPVAVLGSNNYASLNDPAYPAPDFQIFSSMDFNSNSRVRLFYNPWANVLYMFNSAAAANYSLIRANYGPAHTTSAVPPLNAAYSHGLSCPAMSMAIDSATTFAVLPCSAASAAGRYTYDSGASWQPTSGLEHGGQVSTGLVNGSPRHVAMRSCREAMPTCKEGYIETYTASSCSSWTARPRPANQAMDCADIRWGDINNNDVSGRFVAIGNDGSIPKMLYSDDGITWSSCSFTAPEGTVFSAITYV
jgi:hypothetical protein